MKRDWCQDVSDLRSDKDETGASKEQQTSALWSNTMQTISDQAEKCLYLLKNREVTSYGKIV